MDTNQQTKPKRTKKFLIITILSLTGLCLLTVGVLFVTNLFLPQESDSSETLSVETLAYADEALHLMDNFGEAIWPGFGDHLPLIIWNDTTAFLFNAQGQLPGWEQIPDATANGLPVYTQDHTANYQAFTEQLSNDQYAGSMATKNAMNVGFIQMFKENLPPVIAQIFPYRLMLFSTDFYITSLVHESFHAFQAENLTERFNDAEKTYRFTDDYKRKFDAMSDAWQQEMDLLLQALSADNDAEQTSLIRDFLAAREERRKDADLNQNLILHEKRYEWLEGSAKYVELQIWQAASEDQTYQPVREIGEDEDFHAYQRFQKRWKDELTNMQNAAKNGGDTLFYYSGMLQMRLLDQRMPEWKTRMGEENIWIEDLLQESLN